MNYNILNFIKLTINNYDKIDNYDNDKINKSDNYKINKLRKININNKYYNIKNNYENIIYTNLILKNYRYIKYLDNIFDVIDKKINKKKIIIFTELNWNSIIKNKLKNIYNLLIENPKEYFKKYNNSNYNYIFFLSNEINQQNIKVLLDIKNNIYIKINDIIEFNEKNYEIKKINNESKIILNEKFNFRKNPIFYININNNRYKVNYDDLKIIKFSKNQYKYLVYITNNNFENKINYNYINYILKNSNSFFFIIKNTLDYSKSDKININTNKENNRFNYISENYFNYNKEYKINNNGNIIIYMNNSRGFFKKNMNIIKNLIILIKKIRSYNKKNNIKIRFHPKEKDKFKIYLINILNNKNNFNILIDNDCYKKMIKNIYCIFIQNSRIIFDLWNDGIPIFSSNISSLNIFPDEKDYCNNLNYLIDLNKYKENLPNRRQILTKYYKNIFFYDEIFLNKEYIIDLFDKII